MYQEVQDRQQSNSNCMWRWMIPKVQSSDYTIQGAAPPTLAVFLLPCPAKGCAPPMVAHLGGNSGGNRKQVVTPQLEPVFVSVSQGSGMGCWGPVPCTGGKDEEDVGTTLYFARGVPFLESLCDELLVPTGTTPEERTKFPLMTVLPCSFFET